MKAGRGPGMSSDDDKASKVSKVMALFDDVIESSVEGIRKPNPEIYKLACQRISVEPEKCLYRRLGNQLETRQGAGDEND